jgi:hypothetical protein
MHASPKTNPTPRREATTAKKKQHPKKLPVPKKPPSTQSTSSIPSKKQPKLPQIRAATFYIEISLPDAMER